MSLNLISELFGIPEIQNYKLLLRQILSEVLASFLYIALVLSAGAGIRNQHDRNQSTETTFYSGAETILIALANGLVVASLVSIFGHISGCHINPAITIGTMICKQIKPLKAVCFIIAQVLGSIAGAEVAYSLSSKSIRGNLGAMIPYYDITRIQAFGYEFLMTFMLVGVVLSVIDTGRGARGLGSAPLAVGIAMTAGICSCSPYTICMNPIRSLGPAFVMGIWKDHWVYWAGPMAGGLVAGLMYKFLLTFHQHSILIQSSRADLHRTFNAPRIA